MVLKESTFFDKPLALTEPTIPQTKFPTTQKRIQKTSATVTNDAAASSALADAELKVSGLVILAAANNPKAINIRIKKINHKKNTTIDPIATLRIFLSCSCVALS